MFLFHASATLSSIFACTVLVNVYCQILIIYLNYLNITGYGCGQLAFLSRSYAAYAVTDVALYTTCITKELCYMYQKVA